jgi:hypothetical protein
MELCCKLWRKEVSVSFANQFIWRSFATRLRVCDVAHKETMLQILDINEVRCGVDQGAQQITLFGKRGLLPLALRDVLNDAYNAFLPFALIK